MRKLFMTSQTEKQISTIRLLPNIPRIKGNQIMKFGQLIEYYNIKILFFKYHTKNEGVRLVCRTDFGF